MRGGADPIKTRWHPSLRPNLASSWSTCSLTGILLRRLTPAGPKRTLDLLGCATNSRSCGCFCTYFRNQGSVITLYQQNDQSGDIQTSDSFSCFSIRAASNISPCHQNNSSITISEHRTASTKWFSARRLASKLSFAQPCTGFSQDSVASFFPLSFLSPDSE